MEKEIWVKALQLLLTAHGNENSLSLQVKVVSCSQGINANRLEVEQGVISGEWYAHVGEHDSSLKKKEILTNPASWMNSEVCLLLFHSCEAPKVVKFMETESQ